MQRRDSVLDWAYCPKATCERRDGDVTKHWMLTAVLGLFLFGSATKSAAAEFTYRGVKFGMTREAVSKLVPLDGDSNQAASNKGSADKKVAFQFDDKDQLYAIEISYRIPPPQHIMRPALQRELRKKYAVTNPSEKAWDLGEALMSFEEYSLSKQRYLRTRITHKRLYDEYVERLAVQVAPSMQD